MAIFLSSISLSEHAERGNPNSGSISQEQFGQIAHEVMDVVFAVHNQLAGFLAHGSPAALQWINITHGQLLFKTLRREQDRNIDDKNRKVVRRLEC